LTEAFAGISLQEADAVDVDDESDQTDQADATAE